MLAGAIAAAAALVLLVPATGPAGRVLELDGLVPDGAAVAQPPTPASTGRPQPVGASTTSTVSAGLSPARSTAAPTRANPSPARPAGATQVELALEASRSSLGPGPVRIRPTPAASLAGYRWPLAHPRLTLPFGPTVWGSRLVDGKTFHDGVDLATFCGDRVTAAHDGVVLAAGRHYDNEIGWVGDLSDYYARLDRNRLWLELPIVVIVDDGNGYRSVYAHFSRLRVAKGDRVRAGQLLGFEGMTGRASGCHVHYGLFSPFETATFRIKPDVARRMRLPSREIARVDPLLVLPPKAGINAPRHAAHDDTKAASSP